MNIAPSPDTADANPAVHVAPTHSLEQQLDCSQRHLAPALFADRGKTRYQSRALLGMSWVKAKNLQPSESKLRYRYLLNPQGVRRRVQLTRSFLARRQRKCEVLNNLVVLLGQEQAAQAERQA